MGGFEHFIRGRESNGERVEKGEKGKEYIMLSIINFWFKILIILWKAVPTHTTRVNFIKILNITLGSKLKENSISIMYIWKDVHSILTNTKVTYFLTNQNVWE